MQALTISALARTYITQAYPPESHHIRIQSARDEASFTTEDHPRYGPLARGNLWTRASLYVTPRSAEDDNGRLLVVGATSTTPEGAYLALLDKVRKQAAAFLAQKQKTSGGTTQEVPTTLHLRQLELTLPYTTTRTWDLTTTTQGVGATSESASRIRHAVPKPPAPPAGYSEWRYAGDAKAKNCLVGVRFISEPTPSQVVEEQRQFEQELARAAEEEDAASDETV